MCYSRLRTLVMAWMRKRKRAFSSRSSPPRSRARELDWGSPPFTASLSRAAAAFGWSRSRRRGRDSRSTSHYSTRPRSMLSLRKLRSLLFAEQSDGPIHLLLTDVVMPKMRGPELAKLLKGLRTSLRIVYMSGYLEYNRGNEDFLEEGFFLQKPFSRDTLVHKVGEALRNNSKSKT